MKSQNGNVPYFREPMTSDDAKWCEKIAHEIIDASAIFRYEANIVAIRHGLTLAFRRGRYFSKDVIRKAIAIAVFLSSGAAFAVGYVIGQSMAVK